MRTLFITAALLLLSTTALAQIGRPGGHALYSAEIEPHLVLQHADEPWFTDEGIGLGVRASIPIIDNGPITTINNSLALGFGLDWAHFDGNCPSFADNDCNANEFWLPFVVQWNFYFSDLISAFPELGLAVEYSSWEGDWRNGCQSFGGRWCDGDDIDIELVLWLGIRFHLAKEVALTVRLGTPSILLGVSFFM